MSFLERSEMLLGKEAIEKLKDASVIVFGIGGVGGYALEALARTGVGHLTLVDHDVVSDSNRNRQIIATVDSVGKKKVEVAASRVLSINPECVCEAKDVFFLPENADSFDFCSYDYVIDAIDTVSGKLSIIEKAKEAGVPVISCMGAGNKLDPTAFEVADIYQTSVCPLARVMRRECKKRGIKDLKVVYSKEEPIAREGTSTPASVAFVPSVAGFILAGEVIKDLCKG